MGTGCAFEWLLVGCAFEWLVSFGDDLSLIAGPASLDERLRSWKQVHCHVTADWWNSSSSESSSLF